jgi:creatinine amidohydrolase
MNTIHYADLTWPEVAALPRDLPLLVPLGEGAYDLEQAARRLKSGSVVTLPSIPYGFPQSNDLGALAVGAGLLRRVLLGVARELRAQGFRRVIFLDGHRVSRRVARPGLRFLQTPLRPSGIPYGMRGAMRSAMGRDGEGRRPWPEDLSGRVVVVSTGHTEQHGLHLPLDTDTSIVAAIAAGLEAVAPERVVCLPAWPYGVSTHTRQYPGTLNLGGRTFEDFFLAVVGKLARRGARAVLFSNGHGGNHSFLVNVVKWAGERWPETFTATEWLHTTGPALDRHRQSEMGGMGHGCELETSYMLHLRPGSVHAGRAQPETDFIRTPEYFMDWTEGGRLIANPPWTDDTTTGIYGDPTLATAEKGRLWLEAAIQEKVESVDEVLEQSRRRQERRRQRAQAAP